MRGRDARRWAIVAAAVCGVGGAWWIGGVQAEEAGARLAASPTAVAVIDVGAVLEQLDEKSVRLAELQAYGDRLQAEVREVQDSLEAAKADLEVLPRGTAQFVEKQDEAIRLEMKYQGEQEFAKYRFNERLQKTKLDLFNKIVSAAGIYADREGFDVVLNDDRDITVPPEQIGQMNDQAFQAFVASRRVIYAGGTVDITDEVARMMNNNFKAAREP